MKVPVLPSAARTMPAYVEALRLFVSNEFTSELAAKHEGISVHVVATERGGYVEVMVFLVQSLIAVDKGAAREQMPKMEGTQANMPAILSEGEDLGDSVEQALEIEGYEVIIYVREG